MNGVLLQVFLSPCESMGEGGALPLGGHLNGVMKRSVVKEQTLLLSACSHTAESPSVSTLGCGHIYFSRHQVQQLQSTCPVHL